MSSGFLDPGAGGTQKTLFQLFRDFGPEWHCGLWGLLNDSRRVSSPKDKTLSLNSFPSSNHYQTPSETRILKSYINAMMRKMSKRVRKQRSKGGFGGWGEIG